MDALIIPVTVEPHEEGGYLAVCDEIQGCHADGDTIAEALENIAEVAQMIWELCRDKSPPMPRLLAVYHPDTTIEARVIAQ